MPLGVPLCDVAPATLMQVGDEGESVGAEEVGEAGEAGLPVDVAEAPAASAAAVVPLTKSAKKKKKKKARPAVTPCVTCVCVLHPGTAVIAATNMNVRAWRRECCVLCGDVM